jgi:hypothetical protein
MVSKQSLVESNALSVRTDSAISGNKHIMLCRHAKPAIPSSTGQGQLMLVAWAAYGTYARQAKQQSTRVIRLLATNAHTQHIFKHSVGSKHGILSIHSKQ